MRRRALAVRPLGFGLGGMSGSYQPQLRHCARTQAVKAPSSRPLAVGQTWSGNGLQPETWERSGAPVQGGRALMSSGSLSSSDRTHNIIRLTYWAALLFHRQSVRGTRYELEQAARRRMEKLQMAGLAGASSAGQWW